MTYAQPDDLFVVNRNDVTYTVKQEDLMADIQDTDYMLINRNDVTYKISGEDVIGSFIPKLFLDEVILSTTSPGTYYIISVTLDSGGGIPPYTITYEWLKKDSGGSETVIPGETSSILEVPEDLVGFQIACRVTLTDSRNISVTATSDYTDPVVATPKDPRIATFGIEEVDPDSDPRFTDSEFKITASMYDQGVPESSKTIQAYVEGTIKTNVQFNEPLRNVGSTQNIVYSATNMNDGSPGQTTGNIESIFDGSGYDSYFTLIASGTYGARLSINFKIPVPVSGGIKFASNAGNGVNACVLFGPGGASAGYIDGSGWNFNASAIGNSLVAITMTISPGVQARCYGLYQGSSPILIPQKNLTTLQFDADAPAGVLSFGDYLNQPNSGAYGNIAKAGPIVTLDSNAGGWQLNENVVGPSGELVLTDAKRFLLFNQDGEVLGLSESLMDPAWTSQEQGLDSGVNLTLKFPATFSGGEAPDDVLQEGTEIHAVLTAESGPRIDGPLDDFVTPGADAASRTAAQAVLGTPVVRPANLEEPPAPPTPPFIGY